ncbi:hypothetical protein L3X38_012316 [Prunus dulcis]|uniref:Uncharacterized protein n=1 Tax=Prunus dulcis TaxID=3755 RepID=A0AAD4ZFY5_PRUDU|nr:hypothetical protein L3X38_012316 [Prunus dulcis]
MCLAGPLVGLMMTPNYDGPPFSSSSTHSTTGRASPWPITGRAGLFLDGLGEPLSTHGLAGLMMTPNYDGPPFSLITMTMWTESIATPTGEAVAFITLLGVLYCIWRKRRASSACTNLVDHTIIEVIIEQL